MKNENDFKCDKTIAIRVPSKMEKDLRKKARKEHRTLSAYLKILFIKVLGK